jgi:uncharacterized membrane protein
MTLTPGAAIAICAGIGLIIGLLLNEVAWGLIAGAAVGAVIEAYGGMRRGGDGG